ncbi:hypothetical protein A4S05_03800 [Nostoc sp. KVJ20]|nr:hypothetical protein A4S05_03800 [Nostoc sp. KVJ20]
MGHGALGIEINESLRWMKGVLRWMFEILTLHHQSYFLSGDRSSMDCSQVKNQGVWRVWGDRKKQQTSHTMSEKSGSRRIL